MNRIFTLITLTLQGFLAAQWVQIPSPTNFHQLNNLYFINDSVGYAGNQNSIIVTYNGGLSWNMNAGFTDLKKACFVDSLNGFGITLNNFYQTFDGGANWVSIIDSVEITRFYILECVNGNVFVSGNKTIQGAGYWYVSEDTGVSWELRHQQDSIIFVRGRFVDDQNIFGTAVSHYFNSDFSRTMNHYIKSDNGGQSWQTIDFNPAINVSHDIFCPDEDTCFSVNAFNGLGQNAFGIFHLDFSTSIETVIYNQQESLSFIEGFDRSLFIGGAGFLTVSPDRGINWYNQDISFLSGIQRALLACHVFNDSSAIVTGADGCIIRTDNFGLSLREASLPQPNFSVFPNPSNDYQDISLSELTPNSFCSIELFDLRGNLVKQVYSGLSESSNLEIRVDLSNLAAGSYFYRVKTEAGVSQKKMVVY
jgi:photosystem II stability/assembly factor-like uncharacterized protein